jgi:hypothetical protein
MPCLLSYIFNFTHASSRLQRFLIDTRITLGTHMFVTDHDAMNVIRNI